MRAKHHVIAVVLGLLCSVAPMLAPHSFPLEYDAKKPIKLQGVVTKVEWTNPHARIYIDAADPKGAMANWNLELASPSALNRNGWTSHTLKIGDKVTVEGYEGRAASTNRVNAKSIVMADG